MDNEFFEAYLEDAGVEYDEIDSVFVHRGDDGWSISVEHDGEISHIVSLGDEDMQSMFWDDWYWDLIEDDIEIDREVDYAAD
jgi:hypothetical protein